MRVRLNSTLRGRSGRHELQVDAPEGVKVRELLPLLMARGPELRPLLLDASGQLQPGIVAFLNGRQIMLLQGLDTVVASGDTLDFFPKTGVQRAFAES